MIPNISGRPVNIQCNEQALPEFPEMLFGTSIENGITYFDATIYIQKKQPSLSAGDFFRDYNAPVEALCKVYQITDRGDICKLNTEGHLLIDGTFLYLFISFFEPDFLAYMCERMNDLFTVGICVSDTQMLNFAKRLPAETLKDIIGNEQS
ncbi:MAG: hypothetical protein LBM08_00865 [Dysgonamonadaceae bacterium]|jgi:hypothetical protein|nr:hypothetical protein [Dysgonamonadaceae bacterium]